MQGPGGKAEARMLMAASADGPRPCLAQILLLDQTNFCGDPWLKSQNFFLEKEGSKRYRVTG